MATDTQTKNVQSPQTIEGKWLQYRRRFTVSIIIFKWAGSGLKAEYARTNLTFAKEQASWNWNWPEEEVKKPHEKSEKRYIDDEDGNIYIKSGDLEAKVLFELPSEPCVVIESSAVKHGYDSYGVHEELTVYGDLDSVLDNADFVSGVTYPVKRILYDAGFRWSGEHKGYVRL